jgi:hypothetical protein
MTFFDYNDIIKAIPRPKPAFKLEKVPKIWQNTLQVGDTLQYVSSETFFVSRIPTVIFFKNYSYLRFIGYLPDMRG